MPIYEGFREMSRREAYSLFVVELPMEMTWDWLLQIYRGKSLMFMCLTREEGKTTAGLVLFDSKN